MKILIIAHYFPPENNMAVMASLRPYSWAKYWSRADHEICVLTTPKDLKSDILKTLSENKERNSHSVHIEGVQYLLSRPASSFSSNQTSNSKSSLQSKLYPVVRRWLIDLRRILGVGSLLYASNLWIFPALKRALAIYQKWPYDIIVSTFGPPASHIVAGLLKDKLGIFWVADYRDLWHGYDYLNSRWPFLAIEKNLENFLIARADLITAVSAEFARSLKSRFRKEAVAIANGFDAEECPARRQIFPDDQKIRLVHTGTIYPVRRDPTLLFRAVSLLKKRGIAVQEKLELLFYGWDLGNLKELITAYDLYDIVKMPGCVSRWESLQIQQDADALIYLDWDNPSVEGVIGGKIYEYMYSGRPILGMGANSQTAAAKLVTQTGVGLSLGKSVERIADVLENLLQGQTIPYEPVPEFLGQYTREGLAMKMLDVILTMSNA